MRNLPNFDKCKRNTRYRWQSYNSNWSDDRYTTNLEGISDTEERFMVKMTIESLGQKGQYRKNTLEIVSGRPKICFA